jgi:hypothetical protein
VRVSFGLAVVLCACRQPTEIEFDVTTDVPCSHVTSTAIAVAGLDDIEKIPFATTSKLCDGSSLGSLVVVPGNSSNVVVRIVTGLDGSSPDDCVANAYSGGCIVSRRALSFVSNQKLTVPVTMEQSCRDVPCGSGMTCVHGQCEPIAATCTSGSCTLPPPSIPPPHWTKMSAAGLAGRHSFGSAWTGTKLIVFGGFSSVGYANDGGIYDPAADAWSFIPPPSSSFSGRKFPVSVWTGTDLIVWGGIGPGDATAGVALSDGARFNLATYLGGGGNNAWTSIAAPPAPFASGVEYSAAVWAPTTHEMIVWGGLLGSGDDTKFGAAYDPASDRWRMLATSTLDLMEKASAVWVDTRVLIVGGIHDGNTESFGAFYDPSADSWSPPVPLSIPPRAFSAVAWSGGLSDPIAAWGGEGSNYYADGVSFDVNTNRPSELPTTSLSIRGDGAGWMANHQFWTWGGRNNDAVFSDGAYYDFASGTWSTMPEAIFDDGSVLGPRSDHCAVWTGSNAIIWGGADVNGIPYSDGAIFTP